MIKLIIHQTFTLIIIPAYLEHEYGGYDDAKKNLDLYILTVRKMLETKIIEGVENQ